MMNFTVLLRFSHSLLLTFWAIRNSVHRTPVTLTNGKENWKKKEIRQYLNIDWIDSATVEIYRTHLMMSDFDMTTITLNRTVSNETGKVTDLQNHFALFIQLCETDFHAKLLPSLWRRGMKCCHSFFGESTQWYTRSIHPSHVPMVESLCYNERYCLCYAWLFRL